MTKTNFYFLPLTSTFLRRFGMSFGGGMSCDSIWMSCDGPGSAAGILNRFSYEPDRVLAWKLTFTYDCDFFPIHHLPSFLFFAEQSLCAVSSSRLILTILISTSRTSGQTFRAWNETFMKLFKDLANNQIAKKWKNVLLTSCWNFKASRWLLLRQISSASCFLLFLLLIVALN